MKVQLCGNEKMYIIPNGKTQRIPVTGGDVYILQHAPCPFLGEDNMLTLSREDGGLIPTLNETVVQIKRVEFEVGGKSK